MVCEGGWVWCETRGADGGARRASKRGQKRAATTISSDDEQGESSEEGVGRRPTRRLRQTSGQRGRSGRGGPTYAESEQESEGESEGEWV